MKTIFFLLLTISLCSCSEFVRLSKYEKRWSLAHPVAALKAKRLKSNIYAAYNDVRLSNQLDQYANGGKLDAFRHVYAMAVLSKKIDPKKIKKLGIAHEKGNYLDFLKGKNEEDELPDSMSTVMDLANNELGISIGKSLRGKSGTEEIKNKVLAEINAGRALYIKRNSAGEYLNCSGEKIDMQIWKDRWAIPKCLVSTAH